MKTFTKVMTLLAFCMIVWQLSRINYQDLSWAANDSPYDNIIIMLGIILSMTILRWSLNNEERKSPPPS